MPLRLHNTATRRVEALDPVTPGAVLLYTCGPTVHARSHIGNMRTFLAEDCLRRHLETSGLRVRHVMNITDVEDKIIRRARAAGVPIAEFTAPFIAAFHADLAALGVRPAHVHPRATANIEPMLELLRRLEASGHAYVADGSVYFRIASFPAYGRLSGLDPAGLRAGGSGRVDADEYEAKEQVRDFVLWKAAEEGDGAWPSRYGWGRPGWHLECSTIAMAELGETIDLHCGGVDLIFPHHENEIAQSEAATGRPFVRHWVHAEHLLLGGAKMAKSEGAPVTLADLTERGVDPLAVRYLLLSGAHYRHKLHFREEELTAAADAVARLAAFWRRLEEACGDRAGGGPAGSDGAAPGSDARDARDDPLARQAGAAATAFRAALDDDLNVPGAIAAAFDLVREGNRLVDTGAAGPGGARAALAVLSEMDGVLGLVEAASMRARAGSLDEQAASLLRQREAARQARDFAAADRLRAQLHALGVAVEDLPDGTRWRRVG